MNVAEHEFAGHCRKKRRTHRKPNTPNFTIRIFGMNGPIAYSYGFGFDARESLAKARPVAYEASYSLHSIPDMAEKGRN
jgi:hypothetical protein